MPAQLIAETGHAVELTAPEVVIGSGPHVDIPISPALGLAPRHFAISQAAQGARIHALAPGIPLMVNGTPVESALLRDGDCITAAGLRIVYRTPVEEEPPHAPSPSNPRAFFPAHVPHCPNEAPVEITPSVAETNSPVLRAKDDVQLAAEKLISACAIKSLQNSRGPKDESDFNLAFATSLIATVPACLACIYASRWDVMLAVPALLLVGLAVGYLVRLTGKGTETRFGYLAAAASILAVMGTHLFATAPQEAAHLAESAAPETKAYAGEFLSPRGDELPNPAKDRPALFDPTTLDEPDTLAPESAKKPPEKIESVPPAADEPTFDLSAWAWLLLGPTALATYLLVGGTAYFVAIRNTTDSASQHPRELPLSQVHDTSHLSLRERVVLQHHE